MGVNILISSAGRRVGLMNCFRESLAELDLPGRIIAVDATPYASVAQLADSFYVVPRCGDPDFIPELAKICEYEEIKLLIPTIDTELPIFAQQRETFLSRETRISVSSPETVAICYDKLLTHEWLASHSWPVPKQGYPEAVLQSPQDWTLPLILKPIEGSGSAGVRVVSSFQELRAISPLKASYIVQECALGAEHTINVFVDSKGKCRCAVPHLRMETRGGEVSKGVTKRNLVLMQLARDIAEHLPGAYGALNIQCFVRKSDVMLIECNARFGGGYPLTHRAGAPITKWLIEETIGREPSGSFDTWEEDLAMLRYDSAVFVSHETLQNHSYASSFNHLRS